MSNFNDDLFTEPNDKIRDMIKKTINESNDSNVYLPIVNISSEITDAFKQGGYNRKESVYLTGQLLNGLATMIGGLLS